MQDEDLEQCVSSRSSARRPAKRMSLGCRSVTTGPPIIVARRSLSTDIHRSRNRYGSTTPSTSIPVVSMAGVSRHSAIQRRNLSPFVPARHTTKRSGRSGEEVQAARSVQQVLDDVLDLRCSWKATRRYPAHSQNYYSRRERNRGHRGDEPVPPSIRKWLIYLPPTMSPSETSKAAELLEHPQEASPIIATRVSPR